ncbi:histone H1-like [Rhododendron vialii]|uniref:histone H1-like n=1 Tax=Rhododendron vialii TaxID=182163 RepID=UPI00265E848A|nr:histone H1-like [Rhododendron vialii]
MDLFIDPPATTAPPPAPPPVAAEPPIYIAHAANPTPTFASINHSHPPYAEMITAAITALKERNGSSRQAIAKYIEKNYSSLPSNHSALLTHHLKRLKNNGHLLMVKHSYKLPRSVPTLSDGDGGGNGNGNGPSSAPKRGRGRPPKPKVVGQLQPHNNVVVGPDSVLVSLGLADPVARKGPGRPPKAKKKRGPGRPPRPKSFPVSVDGSGLVGAELGGPGVVKRGRGRPPKTKTMMGQSGPKMRSVGPRPRGRPKRDVPMGKPPGRPRGRRPKNVVVGGDGGALGGVGGGLLPSKQQGRPHRVGGIKKPRKLTGRPLGRPRKNASIPGIASQQLVAYEDLKGKLEFFKSRIKQAVITVKPHLNPETALSGFGALQELEELATMDLNAPLNVQVHIQVQEPLVQH